MKYTQYALGAFQWSILHLLLGDGGQLSTNEIADFFNVRHDKVHRAIKALLARNLVERELVRSSRPGRARSALTALWSLNVARAANLSRSPYMSAKLSHWGVEIRLRRTAALISQKELGHRAGISQAMVSHIENRGVNATDETRAKLEAALAAAEADGDHKEDIVRRALGKLSAVELRALGLESDDE